MHSGVDAYYKLQGPLIIVAILVLLRSFQKFADQYAIYNILDVFGNLGLWVSVLNGELDVLDLVSHQTLLRHTTRVDQELFTKCAILNSFNNWPYE